MDAGQVLNIEKNTRPLYIAREHCTTCIAAYCLNAVPGHFAERHFAERHFAERHFAERTFCRRTLCRTNILSNGQFDERTFRRKDILPKRQLAENREILKGKMSVRQNVCQQNVFRQSIFRQNVRPPSELTARFSI